MKGGMDVEQYEGFVCIGITALRDPKTGGYLPAVPLYIREEGGAKEAQEALIQDVGRLFADRIRRYQDECKAAGVPV